MHAPLLDSLKPKTSALGQKLTNGFVWVRRSFSLDAELLRNTNRLNTLSDEELASIARGISIHDRWP